MRARTPLHAAALAAVAAPTMIGVGGSTAHAAPSAPGGDARFCSTKMLTAEQLAAGTKSVISCTTTPAGALALQGLRDGAHTNANGDVVIAYHYDLAAGGGASLAVFGTDCAGGGINLPTDGPSWDNRIGSTKRMIAGCSHIKHWTDASFAGTSQVTGSSSGAEDLNSSLFDQVSSIKYYA